MRVRLVNDIFDINRLPEENEESYIWRLGQAKDSGILDMTWPEIANVINKTFREDITDYRSENAYRKRYSEAKKFFDAGVFSASENDYMNELKVQKDELFKAKKQLYDQRREYNKILTSDARADHLSEKLVEAASKLNTNYPLLSSGSHLALDIHKQGLVTFADWHYGMVTNNIWNTYNTQICRERVSKLISLCKDFIILNNIGALHIAMLGDCAHGAIHASCRVKSEEDTVDQLMNVSEIMAQAITDLSSVVNSIKVYSCYGNHLRTIQNKNDSVHSDNIEKIVPWWLRQRLKDNEKVEIIDSEYKEFTRIRIFDKNILCVHGDLENFKNVGTITNTIFSRKFGETIDYTISADKHHLEEFGQFDIESILVRSLCGTDDHANSKRLYDKAGQTLIVFNDVYGRESTYHIPLD